MARVHARITDRRRDHLHKLSTRIIRENQTVIIEDLAVRNMVRNHSLARAISDASWSEFRRQLEYKADWYGRTVIAVDRFYPIEQDVLGVRRDRREDAAERPGVGVRRVRCAPRPGRERGEGDTGGRAGRRSLRRWCKTTPHVALGGDRQ